MFHEVLPFSLSFLLFVDCHILYRTFLEMCSSSFSFRAQALGCEILSNFSSSPMFLLCSIFFDLQFKIFAIFSMILNTIIINFLVIFVLTICGFFLGFVGFFFCLFNWTNENKLWVFSVCFQFAGLAFCLTQAVRLGHCCTEDRGLPLSFPQMATPSLSLTYFSPGAGSTSWQAHLC